MAEPARRPLKTRSRRWSHDLAGWLGRMGVRPNQVSLMSVVFALLAGGCLLASRPASVGLRITALLVAAACVQLRLLCNMLDGLIAVEGGFRSKSGEIYNELPDRIEDAAILICAGYSITWIGWGPALGWSATALALLTAYVRALAGAAGATQRYCGPMAKPHRMFVITLACIGTAAESALGLAGRVMTVALAIVVVGSAVTATRRAISAIRELESR